MITDYERGAVVADHSYPEDEPWDILIVNEVHPDKLVLRRPLTKNRSTFIRFEEITILKSSIRYKQLELLRE